MTEHRRIVHVDMDAFYAAVEQRDDPRLRGKPVIIGADPKEGRGRGVVSTASYEARVFGIHSAMPISRAYRLCPHGIYIQPSFERYSEASRRVMRVLDSFSPVIEQVSIDEAFLDCTGTQKIFGPSSDLGTKIKSAITETTKLTASVGIAGNKFVAKIASDLNKPDGLTICPPGDERAFLAPLPLRRLWGVGAKTLSKLHSLGKRTIGDLAGSEPDALEAALGQRGRDLRDLAFGLDERPVTMGWQRKSISEERTYAEDVSDDTTLLRTLERIADDLAYRMRKERVRGRTVTLKIRLEGFETHTRSHTVTHAIANPGPILEVIRRLFDEFDRGDRRVRLLGIGLSNLIRTDAPGQMELFSAVSPEDVREQQRDDLLDNLKARFGDHVTRGSLMENDDSTWW